MKHVFPFQLETLVSQYMKELERYYFEEYENFFPLTGTNYYFTFVFILVNVLILLVIYLSTM